MSYGSIHIKLPLRIMISLHLTKGKRFDLSIVHLVCNKRLVQTELNDEVIFIFFHSA
jgi:hypothetical protein